MDGKRDLRVKLQMRISKVRDASFSAGGWRFNETYPVADSLRLIIFDRNRTYVEHDF
jgi:hypothetical protein